MISLILWSLFCFILGALCLRFYQSKLIKFYPDQSPLKFNTLYGEYLSDDKIKKQKGQKERQCLIISIENIGKETVHFESWSIRDLDSQGSLRQLFSFPQNFLNTLKANEKMNFEIVDFTFLNKERLYTIVFRDIHGKEWTLPQEEIKKLKKNLIWQTL